MLNIWGLVLIIVGALLYLAAVTRTKFVLYRILIPSKKIMSKKTAHSIYRIIGIILTALGLLITVNII
ncbi:MAG: hypothetical protein K9L74_02045 [Candidatus Izimaplasma sp.]|nr:hypothetical protein [Candidatus Izimaplasma bacterium]